MVDQYLLGVYLIKTNKQLNTRKDKAIWEQLK